MGVAKDASGDEATEAESDGEGVGVVYVRKPSAINIGGRQGERNQEGGGGTGGKIDGERTYNRTRRGSCR